MKLEQKQTAGLSLAPMATATGLQVNYLLATTYCRPEGKLWMHSIFVVVIALGLLGFALAWSAWRSERAVGEGSSGFLGAVGCSFSLSMLAFTTAQWVPAFWLGSCGH